MAEPKQRAEIWITAEALRDVLGLPSDSQITGVELNARTERFSFFVTGSAFPRCFEGGHPTIMSHEEAQRRLRENDRISIPPELERSGRSGPFQGVVTTVRYD